MTLYSAPLPGSGPVLTFILNILDNIVPYKDEGITWQRIIESYKWGYAMRTELGDPDFVNMSKFFKSTFYIAIYKLRCNKNFKLGI